MRTGILGGTFDPIHVAHLHAGETALHQAGLDRVLFMPAGDPWQKDDRVLTPAAQRVEMLRLATSGVAGFEVDERELHRAGPTYTLDTMSSFPESEELCLILGADAAARIMTWHRWEEVVGRAAIVVAPRPGTDLADVQRVLPESKILEMAALDVSATSIRRLARNGEPYRFLVPAAVHAYMEANRLYAQTPPDDRVGASTDQEDPS